MEYLVDYASEKTKIAGKKLIDSELNNMEDGKIKEQLLDRLQQIEQTDKRDLYF